MKGLRSVAHAALCFLVLPIALGVLLPLFIQADVRRNPRAERSFTRLGNQEISFSIVTPQVQSLGIFDRKYLHKMQEGYYHIEAANSFLIRYQYTMVRFMVFLAAIGNAVGFFIVMRSVSGNNRDSLQHNEGNSDHPIMNNGQFDPSPHVNCAKQKVARAKMDRRYGPAIAFVITPVIMVFLMPFFVDKIMLTMGPNAAVLLEKKDFLIVREVGIETEAGNGPTLLKAEEGYYHVGIRNRFLSGYIYSLLAKTMAVLAASNLAGYYLLRRGPTRRAARKAQSGDE